MNSTHIPLYTHAHSGKQQQQQQPLSVNQLSIIPTVTSWKYTQTHEITNTYETDKHTAQHAYIANTHAAALSLYIYCHMKSSLYAQEHTDTWRALYVFNWVWLCTSETNQHIFWWINENTLKKRNTLAPNTRFGCFVFFLPDAAAVSSHVNLSFIHF